MSRIGKKPIIIPDSVTTQVSGQKITVKGGKGELNFVANDEVALKVEDKKIFVEPRNLSKSSRSKWGMSRSMIENLITGVTEGFSKKLEISGVGYRAAMQGADLQLSLGFSHEILYKVPSGISVTVPKPTEILVSGINKQQVGQVASEIREYRSPEPYKGKGIKYADERIVRKEGKKK